MTTEYRKTPDPNVFIKADTSESFIYLDELTAGIDELQEQIDDLPQPKTKPDQETLDFYNAEIEMHGEKEMLEEEVVRQQHLLNTIKSLKAVVR